MAIIEPTASSSAATPADGVGAGGFSVAVTLPSRNATPEQHADALLAALGFDAADLAAYQRQHGVDLRQHFVNSFRTSANERHHHYPNGKGGFTALIPFDRKWYGELRQFASTNGAGATTQPSVDSPSGAVASRQGVDLAAQQRARLNNAAGVPPGDGIPNGFTPEQRELILDLTQMGLDIAGIVDPTPISDGTNGVISLFRGDLLGAGVSVAGFLPVLGDLAKLAKVKRWINVIERVVQMARADARFGEFVRFGVQKIKSLLDRVPVDKLPTQMREAVESLKSKLDEFFAAGPSHTRPSGNGQLTGRPEPINPNDKDPSNIRALTRQNESAVALKDAGYKVEQGPTITAADLARNPGLKPTKNPDYRIEGEIFDAYSPSTSSARNIASVIEQTKVNTGQANRIVLNLDDSGVSVAALRQQLTDYPIPGLKEIIIVKGGKVIPFFPFK